MEHKFASKQGQVSTLSTLHPPQILLDWLEKESISSSLIHEVDRRCVLKPLSCCVSVAFGSYKQTF